MMPTSSVPTSASASVHQMTRSTMATGVSGRLGRRGVVWGSDTRVVYLRGLAWSMVTGLLLVTSAARAGDPGDKIRLDLARGPLFTSSRIMGLGGAYAGVAVGIDGVWRNPATLANRPDYSTDWLDYDLTFDWFIPSSDAVDVDGDGRSGSRDYDSIALTLGASLQLGAFAFGVLALAYGYSGGADVMADELDDVDLLFDAAYAFDDGQWIVGAGVLTSSVALTSASLTGGNEVDITGAALDLGVLYRPRQSQWRIGARQRIGAELGLGKDGQRDDEAPIQAAVPWQLGLGASLFMAGDPGRQYNARLRSKQPRLVDRRYLLLSGELVVVGATHGESLEALLAGSRRASGRNPSVSVHLGAEGEIFDHRLRTRVGTYFEPNRVADGLAGRLHFTGGTELRLFELIVDWKLTFAFDVAPGWRNITVGVGFWK